LLKWTRTSTLFVSGFSLVSTVKSIFPCCLNLNDFFHFSHSDITLLPRYEKWKLPFSFLYL
jgi:hypothetical protein